MTHFNFAFETMPLNVMILAAGESKRFKDIGIDTPKALLEVEMKKYFPEPLPLARWVTAWMARRKDVVMSQTNFTIICQNADFDLFNRTLSQDTTDQLPKFSVIGIPKTTGQAESASIGLEAMKKFGLVGGMTVIMNCDMVPLYPMDLFAAQVSPFGHGAATFRASSAIYSYVNGFPVFTDAAEKKPITSHAMAGQYAIHDIDSFRTALDKACDDHEEPYISQAYQYLDEAGLNVEIPEGMYLSFGTPDEIRSLSHRIPMRFTDRNVQEAIFGKELI